MRPSHRQRRPPLVHVIIIALHPHTRREAWHPANASAATHLTRLVLATRAVPQPVPKPSLADTRSSLLLTHAERNIHPNRCTCEPTHPNSVNSPHLRNTQRDPTTHACCNGILSPRPRAPTQSHNCPSRTTINDRCSLTAHGHTRNHTPSRSTVHSLRHCHAPHVAPPLHARTPNPTRKVR